MFSTPPAIEISTLGEILVTFSYTLLFFHDGYRDCLEVDVKPPSLLPLLGFSSPFVVDLSS